MHKFLKINVPSPFSASFRSNSEILCLLMGKFFYLSSSRVEKKTLQSTTLTTLSQEVSCESVFRIFCGWAQQNGALQRLPHSFAEEKNLSLKTQCRVTYTRGGQKKKGEKAFPSDPRAEAGKPRCVQRIVCAQRELQSPKISWSLLWQNQINARRALGIFGSCQ